MAAIVTVAQMKAMEKEADRKGISYDRMMDHAGKAVADALLRRYGPVRGKRLAVLCGGGNNGGDGLVASLHLLQAGADVRVFLVKDRDSKEQRRRAVEEAGIPVWNAAAREGGEALADFLPQTDLVLDAVLGTGAKLPLRQPAGNILSAVRQALDRPAGKPYVVAVDCPSGLDCDTGAVSPETIPADLTVTLGAAKPGLLTFPGAEYVGALEVADIGLPADLAALPTPGAWLATPDLLRHWLKPRRRDSHKGTFGSVLIVGGSVNYPGAPVLAGQGAYRCGAGLVTLAVIGEVYNAVVSALPEATWIVLPEDLGVIAPQASEVLSAETDTYDVLVIGPGFGREKSTAVFLRDFLQDQAGVKTAIGFIPAEQASAETHRGKRPPLVMDADALKMLAAMEGWPARLPPGSILTPHPGEMSILCGLDKDAIQKDRAGTAVRFAREWNTVVVLKGAFTVVATPDGTAAILPFATPALARAGTGDVLAGAIGGLVAQGMESRQAAILGAYLHGRAGEMAAGALQASDSVLAGDVARNLAPAIAELRGRR